MGAGPGKFAMNPGFNSTKVRTQRFGVTSGLASQGNNGANLGLSAATSPNYNVVGSYNHFASGPNTTNNASYQHKQRQLSYSPNMQAAGCISAASRENSMDDGRTASPNGEPQRR